MFRKLLQRVGLMKTREQIRADGIKAVHDLNANEDFMRVVANTGLAHFWNGVNKAFIEDDFEPLKAELARMAEKEKK